MNAETSKQQVRLAKDGVLAPVPGSSEEEDLTSEQATRMLAVLSNHYGERVAPASHHCSALLEWARVMRESGYAPSVEVDYGHIRMLLMKSNLASRLIYGGENVRTRRCPVHEGTWSGCRWGSGMCEEGCMDGSNVTGWLVPTHGFEPMETNTDIQERWDFDYSARCRFCGGTKEGAAHA